MEPQAGPNIQGNRVCAAVSNQNLNQKQKLMMQLLVALGEVAVWLDVFGVSLLMIVPIRQKLGVEDQMEIPNQWRVVHHVLVGTIARHEVKNVYPGPVETILLRMMIEVSAHESPSAGDEGAQKPIQSLVWVWL
jgi:hypothetical protein